MRTSEYICVLFLCLFILLALVRPIRLRNRLRVVALGTFGFLLIWAGYRLWWLRDWIPALIMLLVYWQGGSFSGQTHEKLQRYLQQFDERILHILPKRGQLYWEISYFLVYPLVPGAIIMLYALGLGSEIDFFWTVVLPPTFLCYFFVSFYQTYPPWKFQRLPESGIVRKLNFIVIRYASIQLNTFPSAHVTVAISIGLVMMHLNWIAGLLFFFFAVSIMTSTVTRRYHYAADAIIGMFLAAVWYATAAIWIWPLFLG